MVDVDDATAVVAAETPRSVRFKGEDLAIPDAFWDADGNRPNLGALVKSHADLRRKLSEQKPEVPETYELAAPEELAERVSPDADDPLAQQAMDWARRHGLGQEAFSELAALYYGRLAESAVDREAEIGKLKEAFGARTEAEVAGLGDWVEGLLGDTLSRTPNLFAALDRLTATADGVLLLKAFRDRIAEPGLPSGRGGGAGFPDAAALRALQASDAYLAGDPAVRKNVAQGWARLYPETEA